MDEDLSFCELFRRKSDNHEFIRYDKGSVLFSTTEHSGNSDVYHYTEEELANDYIKIKEWEENYRKGW